MMRCLSNDYGLDSQKSMLHSAGYQQAGHSEISFNKIDNIGYVNKTTEEGKKYICPKEPEACIMRWCYEQLATGNWYIDQVWRAAREKGLNCGRKNFWQIIRNPVYCGKIFIAKYKDEEAHLVAGSHEPIVSEALLMRLWMC